MYIWYYALSVVLAGWLEQAHRVCVSLFGGNTLARSPPWTELKDYDEPQIQWQSCLDWANHKYLTAGGQRWNISVAGGCFGIMFLDSRHFRQGWYFYCCIRSSIPFGSLYTTRTSISDCVDLSSTTLPWHHSEGLLVTELWGTFGPCRRSRYMGPSRLPGRITLSLTCNIGTMTLNKVHAAHLESQDSGLAGGASERTPPPPTWTETTKTEFVVAACNYHILEISAFRPIHQHSTRRFFEKRIEGSDGGASDVPLKPFVLPPLAKGASIKYVRTKTPTFRPPPPVRKKWLPCTGQMYMCTHIFENVRTPPLPQWVHT